jgi:hypothetical protein
MKERGYKISNPHSDATTRESLSEILDPLAPECEPFNDPPPEIMNIFLPVTNLLLKKSHHFHNLKVCIPFIQICLMFITYMSTHFFITHHTLHISLLMMKH